MKIRKAVIPAAGLGTRFLPATKAQAKEMMPVVDKPAIQYIVEEAVGSGIESILIITGRYKQSIEDHFDTSFELENCLEKSGNDEMLATLRTISSMASIHYIRQKEAKGLGHAVWCARQFVGDEPFAVLLGDDIVSSPQPALKQMIEVYQNYDTEVLGVQPVKPSEAGKYGIVKPTGGRWRKAGEALRISDVVEKPAPGEAPSNLAVIGRYILKPDIFRILQNTQPGIGGEIQLTDALRTLCTDHQLLALPIAGRRFDVGDKLGYLQATIRLALDRPEFSSDILVYMEAILAEINSKKQIIGGMA